MKLLTGIFHANGSVQPVSPSLSAALYTRVLLWNYEPMTTRVRDELYALQSLTSNTVWRLLRLKHWEGL